MLFNQFHADKIERETFGYHPSKGHAECKEELRGTEIDGRAEGIQNPGCKESEEDRPEKSEIVSLIRMIPESLIAF